MKVFISVVSHNHCDLINSLGVLGLLSKDFIVVLKSNTPDEQYDKKLLRSPNFNWIDQDYGLGFGENNNHIFDYCKNNLSMSEDDLFIVLNPDVILESSTITNLVESMNVDNVDFATINLYRDSSLKEYDPSIRLFPNFSIFVLSFLFGVNKSIINKENLCVPTVVDWAAGSFLAFKAEHYSRLTGFDESYFMYCEDIDICFRSKMLGIPLWYYPDIKAVHFARQNNRKIFSKHFYWHVLSSLRFLFNKLKYKLKFG